MRLVPFLRKRLFACSRIALVVVLAMGASPTTAAAAADDDDYVQPPADRWILGADFGLSNVVESRTFSTAGPLERPLSEKDDFDSRLIRVGLELQGPVIEGLWGSPRPFARGGLQFATLEHASESGSLGRGGQSAFLSQPIADVFNPPPMPVPPPGVSPPGARLPITYADFNAATIPGQGFVFDAEPTPIPGGYLGVGIAINIPFPAETIPGWFSIKPSIDYSLRHYSFRAETNEVAEPTNDVFEATTAYGTESFLEHRIGPGIELEATVRGTKRFSVSAYFLTKFLFLVGDGVQNWGDGRSQDTTQWSAALQATNVPNTRVIPNVVPGSGVVRFHTEADDVVVALGGGIRFRFY